LSLRLVWSNTAFEDEVLYVEAGHLEWAHWLHGTPAPPFPTWFSGAPVLYPPLGALADSAGGLAGARILSLFFMLGATALCYSMTSRLWGRTAAIFAAGLFASLGSTQYLGAFATYDAMALFLLAAATWLCVRAAGEPAERAVPLLVAAGITLALANASKYATGLFDPVVILAAMLATTQAKNRKDGAAAGLIVATVAALSIMVAMTFGGAPYRQGIAFTTLARATGTSPAFAVWYLSAGWVGIVASLAVAGALAATFRPKPRSLKAIAWLLAGAALLVPAEQARIHVITSLFKHDDFGAWLAAPVAGYALASFPRVIAKAKARAALAVGGALLALSALLGVALAWNQFHVWPDAATLVADAQPVLKATSGPVLAGDNGYLAYYYLHGAGRHQFWGAGFAAYSSLLTNASAGTPATETSMIRRRYFAVIILSFHQSAWIDEQTKDNIKRYGGYREAANLPYWNGHDWTAWELWVRE
jgi:4-amino-4-deoxy-L-arabinose transferase-like glycosyltransferase